MASHASATLSLFEITVSKRSAVFSECGRYRYRLDRTWSRADGRVCWVMLNPSDADAVDDDPTLTRITGFTKRWGYGGLVVVNLYAWKATQPTDIPADLTIAIGPDADEHIAAALRDSTRVVCGWGNSIKAARRRERERQIFRLIRAAGHSPTALRFTKDGAPWHPLYLKSDLTPQDFPE